jgi:hypothetical protein
VSSLPHHPILQTPDFVVEPLPPDRQVPPQFQIRGAPKNTFDLALVNERNRVNIERLLHALDGHQGMVRVDQLLCARRGQRLG